MTWQWNNLFFPLFVGAMLVFYAAIYVARRRVRGSRLGAALLVSVGIWLAASLLEVLGGDLETKVFWTKVQYFGITAAPSLWMVLALRFSGRDDWISLVSMPALFLIPAVTLGLVLTNDFHSLVWTAAWIPAGGHTVIKALNVWYYIFLAHSYFVIVSGVSLIAITLVQTRRMFRWQAIIFMVAVILPIFSNMFVDNFKEELRLRVEITPFVMAVSVPMIAWGLFRLRALDIVPIARNSVIESIKDAIIILDGQNRVTDINPAASKLLGAPKKEIVWRTIDQVNPQIGALVANEMPAEEKEIFLDMAGEKHIFDLVKSPVFDSHQEVISQVLVFHDITERVQAETLVKEALYEKEILLKEVHHRVKNNLQVIISLLNLQSRQTGNFGTKSFLESQNRIQSMAFVHEQLYQHEKLSKIDFAKYTQDLVDYLVNVYQANQRNIHFNLNIDRFDLDIDQAIPCGLVLNELISNALKYAFPDEFLSGQIDIRMWVGQSSTVYFQIADNGVGMPVDFDPSRATTLGLQLVHRLTQQLGGDLQIQGGGGTKIEIKFPYTL